MNVVNLTPHTINVITEEGMISYPASGTVARVLSITEVRDTVMCIPVTAVEYGQVEFLPDPQPDTIYLVSSMVLDRVSGRNDVYAPDTSPYSVVRDDDGRIVGVKCFRQ